MPTIDQTSSVYALIPLVGASVSLLGILVTLCFGVWQNKKRFAWDKAMVAYDLLRIWTEKTIVHREVVEARYGTYLMNLKPISPPHCEVLVNSKKGEDDYEIKIAVVSLMNYFEDVAVLYSTDMADRDVIDNSLRRPMSRYYRKIKPLADCIDQVAGYKSWKPLDDLIATWEKEDEQQEKKLERRSFP